MKTKAARLRELISKGAVALPGVPNAAIARQVEQAGFEAVYISGAGMANATAGVPDIGLLTLTEVAQLAGYVASAGFRQLSMLIRDLAERKMWLEQFVNSSVSVSPAGTLKISNFRNAVGISLEKILSILTRWWERSKRPWRRGEIPTL